MMEAALNLENGQQIIGKTRHLKVVPPQKKEKKKILKSFAEIKGNFQPATSKKIDRRTIVKRSQTPGDVFIFLDLRKTNDFVDLGEVMYIMPYFTVIGIKVLTADAKKLGDRYHKWCVAKKQLYLGRQTRKNFSFIYITKIKEPNKKPNWDKDCKKSIIVLEERLVHVKAGGLFPTLEDAIPNFSSILAGEYYGVRCPRRLRKRIAFETYRWAKHVGGTYMGVIPYQHELAIIIRK